MILSLLAGTAKDSSLKLCLNLSAGLTIEKKTQRLHQLGKSENMSPDAAKCRRHIGLFQRR
jgi:hypothetical protein